MENQLDPQVLALAKAIRYVESKDNYTARSKDGSFGAYQFIKPTWDATAKKYGVTAAWDKATRGEQNKVAYMQLKEWKDKGFSPGQIASMWNAGAGRPNAYKTGLSGTNKDGVNYNVSEYAKKVGVLYQQYKQGVQSPSIAPQAPKTMVETIESARQQREQQELPLSTNPNRSEPTVGGEIVRGLIRPFVRGVNTVVQPLQALIGKKNISDIPTYDSYLGDVSGFGMKDNQTTNQRLRDVAGGALEIGASLVPVGKVAGTVSKGLASAGLKQGANLAGKTIAGATLGYGFDAGTKLQNQEIPLSQALKPGLGTATGGLFAPVAAGTGAVLRGVAGKTSGTGSDVLQRAFNNPDAVGEAVKTFAKSPEAKKELVDTAKDAVQKYLSSRSQEYGSSIGKLTSQVGFIGKKNVQSMFEKSVGKFGGKIKNGNITFTDTTLSKADQNTLKQALAKINGWKNTSVKGIDDLRQALNNIADDYKMVGGSRANVVIGDVVNGIKSNLEKTVPGYRGVLKNYGQKTFTAKQIMKELNLGGQAKETTQINQIMRLFRKDPEVLKKLYEVMGPEQAEKFLDEIAGAILSEWAPRGVLNNIGRTIGEGALAAGALITGSGALGAGFLAGAAGMSPRIVGKTARTLGSLKNAGVNNLLRKGGSLGASSN